MRTGRCGKSLWWYVSSGTLLQAFVPVFRISPGPDVAHKYKRQTRRKDVVGASRKRTHSMEDADTDDVLFLFFLFVLRPDVINSNSDKRSDTDAVTERRIAEGIIFCSTLLAFTTMVDAHFSTRIP